MKKTFPVALFITLLAGVAILPVPVSGAEVAMLFKQELADMPGKAGQLLTVEFAPGKCPPLTATMPILSSTYWKVPS